VVTATESSKPLTLDELVPQLKAISNSIGKAHQGIDELVLGPVKKVDDGCKSPAELVWVLRAFTDEALLDLEWMTQEILRIRFNLNAGRSDDEAELWQAVGGRDDA
jgi:hypothetical protein